ncbi:hypothetical protein WR25_08708 [Diploscapter pachys]|uniref:Cwf19-like C-terminal domain-containing protein n=1 Tax=Diploscapter pachys TaxID=2018661 RepID=A0A2A2LLW2_9BILA|nr:hypothetical protein WR25_08708 [Diploscapter pachys]
MEWQMTHYELQNLQRKCPRGHSARDNESSRKHRRLERSLDDCIRCIDSAKLDKACIVAIGINTYLAVVEWDGLDEQHCIIVPNGHYSSTIQLDENVWDEMRIWRKGLVAMWKEQDKDCVFMEMARDVQHGGHIFVECIPVPQEIGDMAPIYFNKAINECEGEHADNKKLIETKDLRRQIPKGFSYFAVDFGLQNGYAHAIEDVSSFPVTFGHEILVGMMDLPASKWRKKEKMELSKLRQKCEAMKKDWDKFDWTKKIERDK